MSQEIDVVTENIRNSQSTISKILQFFPQIGGLIEQRHEFAKKIDNCMQNDKQ
jgi:hypothetical protein